MEPGLEAGISAQMSEALVTRIARLERSNDTLRRTNLILVFGVVATLALSLFALSSAGFFQGGDRTWVGQGIVLRDANGVSRGSWQLGEEGSTVLQLQDRNGIGRLRMSVLESGDPGIALTDSRGRTRIVVGLLPDQGGTLAFADADGNTRVVLGVAPDDASTLVFVDANGVTRAGLGVAADGNPNLTLFENAPAQRDTTSQSN